LFSVDKKESESGVVVMEVGTFCLLMKGLCFYRQKKTALIKNNRICTENTDTMP
jgi:hypothetical protein